MCQREPKSSTVAASLVHKRAVESAVGREDAVKDKDAHGCVFAALDHSFGAASFVLSLHNDDGCGLLHHDHLGSGLLLLDVDVDIGLLLLHGLAHRLLLLHGLAHRLLLHGLSHRLLLHGLAHRLLVHRLTLWRLLHFKWSLLYN